MKRRVFVQRSIDGSTLYFRPGPEKRWDMIIYEQQGSRYMFEELERGEGRWYTITPAKTPKR